MNEQVSVKEGTYTQEEAFQSSLEYFKGDELAARVWVNKYALKDSFGNIFEKNPDDMHRRLAKEISRIEKTYENPMSEDEIFEVLRDFKYIVMTFRSPLYPIVLSSVMTDLRILTAVL